MNDAKQTNRPFDLEERTTKFSESIILFCRSLPVDLVSKPLIQQLVRSGTSIGANYFESNGASSKKDFKNKIHIAKKEANETLYWLRTISVACPNSKNEARILWKECQELTFIFGKIIATLGKQ